MAKTKPYPQWICHNCGINYCKGFDDSAKRCATFHLDTCGCCGAENVPCTEPRDYNHFRCWPPELEEVIPFAPPKSRQSPEQQLVQCALDGFNFERLQAMMQAVNWRYYTRYHGMEVPDVERLKAAAKDLLTRVVNDPGIRITSTGGFEAEAMGVMDDGTFDGVMLRFVFEESEAWWEDLGK
jgi:hypothetical protein